jgi:hypothetical protein
MHCNARWDHLKSVPSLVGTGARAGARLLSLLLLSTSDGEVLEAKSSTDALGRGEGVLLEVDANLEEDVVTLDERVADSEAVGLLGSKRDETDSLDGADESVVDILLGDIEDKTVVDETILVNLSNGNTIEERLDVKLAEEGNSGSGDTLVLLDEVDGVDDLNGTTSNLGGNVEGLEERSLSRVKRSRTSRDVNIDGGDNTGLGSGGDLVGTDNITDLTELVRVGEDETNVVADVLKKVSDLGVASSSEVTEDRADDGVLTDKHDGVVLTELHADKLDLVRTDVINVTNNDVLVVLNSLGESSAELGLSAATDHSRGLADHDLDLGGLGDGLATLLLIVLLSVSSSFGRHL